ncbi:hypothetical protein JGUZn3_10090 [Entomobacter blattae]|uniref:Uncharacterized protein n=1 Tax=Entomobacter blattae TaxID=2762277 RepID=A0A7H1NR28_9PROT|nr:hypothetical protein JGUZn3_10090 [Entomobacter blattae]
MPDQKSQENVSKPISSIESIVAPRTMISAIAGVAALNL